MVLGRHGYETAIKGKNSFVCTVERSWSAGIDDPIFGIPSCGLRFASTRRPRDLTFHLRSSKPNWYWLDDPKLRRSRKSKQEGIAEPGSRRDVLYDFKARVFERS
jgi:hypothetical protein